VEKLLAQIAGLIYKLETLVGLEGIEYKKNKAQG